MEKAAVKIIAAVQAQVIQALQKTTKKIIATQGLPRIMIKVTIILQKITQLKAVILSTNNNNNSRI